MFSYRKCLGLCSSENSQHKTALSVFRQSCVITRLISKMSENCEETFYSVTLNPSAWFWQVPSLSIVLCLSHFVSYLHEKRAISLTKNVVAFHRVLIWYYLPGQEALRSGPILLEPAYLCIQAAQAHSSPVVMEALRFLSFGIKEICAVACIILG